MSNIWIWLEMELEGAYKQTVLNRIELFVFMNM